MINKILRNYDFEKLRRIYKEYNMKMSNDGIWVKTKETDILYNDIHKIIGATTEIITKDNISRMAREELLYRYENRED